MSASAEKAPAKARKPSLAEGRRELKDLLRTVQATEERRLNPFHVDLQDALALADRYFPLWDEFADLELDARALNALSRVVKMQEGRLRYQAQLFHADPEAMAAKLQKFPNAQLGKLFLESWHPVVELEQLTAEALEEAQDYWEAMPTVEERHRVRPRRAPPQPENVTLDDLLARGVIARDGFGSHIAALWADLQGRGPTSYWDFIGEVPGQRVQRAYATSYLITYGYAWLAQEGSKLTLHPRGARDPPQRSVSLPLVVAGAAAMGDTGKEAA